jgi:hypothetical protein
VKIARKHLFLVIAVAVAIGFGAEVFAQGPVIYPKKGQSQDQLKKDRFACYEWARGKTGFDPMAATGAGAPPPQGTRPNALRGAAGGAALGAVGGAIGGNAGKGAAIGAATGALVGGVRRRRQERLHQQAAQDQASAQANRRNEYNRAFGACMEGRGYTVK